MKQVISANETSDIITEVYNAAAKYYHNKLDNKSKKYLTDRGLNEETISKFLLGYADGNLRRHLLTEKKFSLDVCIQSGLLKKLADGIPADYFQNRIIIPNSIDNKIIFFSGRSLLDNDKFRYLNLPGHIDYLFNEPTQPQDTLYLVEGQIDALTLIQNHFDNVTGLFGITSYNEEKRARIENLVKKIYLIFDGDDPGRATMLNIAKNSPEKYRIVSLPDNEDINSYLLKHNVEDLKKLIDKSKDVITLKIDLIADDNSDFNFEKLTPIIEDISNLKGIFAEEKLQYLKTKLKLNSAELQSIRKELSQQRKVIQKPSKSKKPVEKEFIAKFDSLVDLVIHKGNVCFLIREGNDLVIKGNHIINNNIFYPPPQDAIPWLLPRGEKIIEHYDHYKEVDYDFTINHELVNDIMLHLQNSVELPDQFYYPLLSFWVLHTYFLDKFSFTPYLVFLGAPEHGKTRAGKSLLNISYRGIHVEALREAYIFRMSEHFQSTIFFDCRDLMKKLSESKCDDLFLLRFNKGARVYRVLFPDKGRFKDTVHFDIYGSTIIATNHNVEDILSTRCISIPMRKSDRDFENDITAESCLELKERILALKARYLFTDFPPVVKPAKSRLGDIMKPLYQLIKLLYPLPELEEVFLKFVEKLETDKIQNQMESIEQGVLQALFILRNSVTNGHLSIKEISHEFNVYRDPRFHKSNNSIGWILKDLQFQKITLPDGTRAIEFNEKLLNAQLITHGLEYLLEKNKKSGDEFNPFSNM